MSMLEGTAGQMWHSFVRAYRVLAARLDAELQDKHDLPLSRFEALSHLHMAGPVRMHEFADRLVLSRSATTRFVDRLEKEGLVKRRLCADDRRGMELSLTTEGSNRLNEAAPTYRQALERHLLGRLDSDLANLLAGALTMIVAEDDR